MLAAETVEALRPAVEGTLSGRLLAAGEARAEAEALHAVWMTLLNRLLDNEKIKLASLSGVQAEAANDLAGASFCRQDDGLLSLTPADDLDSEVIAEFFCSMFKCSMSVRLLAFMTEGHHDPYVARLVELMPELQRGFSLSEEETETLLAVARLFPSVWATLARPILMISTHRSGGAEQEDESIIASDRTSFWEAVVAAVHNDFRNPALRGFLYDYMGVAEIEERSEIFIKSKEGLVGAKISTEIRNAVRQYADPEAPSPDPIYVLVRMLPRVVQPWEEEHPKPEFPLEPDSSSD